MCFMMHLHLGVAAAQSDAPPEDTGDDAALSQEIHERDVRFPELVQPMGRVLGPIDANVWLRVVVDVHGSVSSARPLRSEPLRANASSLQLRRAMESAEMAATDAALRAVFRPAVVDGAPRAVAITLQVEVGPLSDAPPTPPAEGNPGEERDTRADMPLQHGGSSQDEVEAGETNSEDTNDAGASLRQALDDDLDEDMFGATAEIEAAPESDAASVSDINYDAEALRRVPRTAAQSLLTLAPGLMTTQHASEGHAMGMFLRGFNAGEGEDLEVLVDDMPINEVSNAHGHGYVDLGFVALDAVSRLRVTQGPFDPVQGDFATAGTASYELAAPTRGLHARASYGRFRERRIGVLWGPAWAEDGTFAAFQYAAGDGFGPNRAFSNGAVNLRWESKSGPVRYSVFGFGSTAQWSTAGVLRAEELIDGAGQLDPERCSAETFFCSYDPNQGGSSSQAGLVARLHRSNGVNGGLSLTAYGRWRTLRVRENFTGFLTDPRTDGGPQRGDNLDQNYDVVTGGLRARYRIARRWRGQAQRFELGLSTRFDDAETSAIRRRAARLVPYRTEFDRRVRETTVGAYATGVLRWKDSLRLRLGIRVDHFGFRVDDRNEPAIDDVGPRLRVTRFGASGLAVSPRGTLDVKLASPLRWVTSVGLGARSSDAAALSEAELAPFARVTAIETGFVLAGENDFESEASSGDDAHAHATPRVRAGWHGELRSSVFTTRVSSDLVFDPSAGRNIPLGASARSGVLLQGRAHVGPWLDLALSATWTSAHLVSPDASAWRLLEGKLLPFVPRFVGRLDVVGHTGKLGRSGISMHGALGLQAIGRRPLPLGQTARGFALLDLSLSGQWRMVEVGASMTNVLDARFNGEEFFYASSFRDPSLAPSRMATRHFAAGPPRSFLLTLSLHWEPAPR